jgi:hypothetical protein
MSKRAAQFERHERDLYLTPVEAVLPLKPFIKEGFEFYEPCAADGGLARELALQLRLRCTGMSDIVPLASDVAKLDLHEIDTLKTGCFITNPPWDRKLLHGIIDHLKWIAPTWLLLDSDWLFTKQAAPYIPDATHIVAVGRVRWIPGSEFTGKDNVCWVRFAGGWDAGPTFYPNW